MKKSKTNKRTKSKKAPKKALKKKAINKKPLGSSTPKRELNSRSKTTSNKAGVMPLGDRVLVKPQPTETTTSFGIIIPDTAKEKPETGMVVAVGPGRKLESGTVQAVGVKVGDKVMFNKYGFDEIKIAGVEYYLISEANILAILN